jgi:thioredoxin 1
MMRKLAFAMLMVAIGTLSCSSSDGKKSTTENSEAIATSNDSELGKPIHLTKALFLEKIMNYEENAEEWIYKGDKPGLVDFYADWCRPCKITSPILDELAVEYAGKIDIYKVNVDQEKELAAVFGVQSIPTFLFMPMEGKPSVSSGIAQTPEQTKEMFRQQIEEILLKNGKM